MENSCNVPQAVQDYINKTIIQANDILNISNRKAILSSCKINSLEFYSDRTMQFLRLRKQDYLTIVSFIFKYQDLPDIQKLEYCEEDGELKVDDFKGYLNFIRPIIFNQENNCYYDRVLSTFKRLLTYKDCETGCGIICYNQNKEELNDIVILRIETLRKNIKEVINKSDLDFLYNGYLQHDDEKYVKRLITEKQTDVFNQTIIKNALVLNSIMLAFEQVFSIFKYLIGFGLLECKEKDNFYYY